MTPQFDSFQVTLASAQMQIASKVARDKMRRLLSKAKTDPKRLAAAERLVEGGDLDTACLIYKRLALSRPKRYASEFAQDRIQELQAEARAQLETVSSDLDGVNDPNKARKAFDRLLTLADKYGGVPVVNKEIRKKARKSRPLVNEAEAVRLFVLGQQYERDQQVCCAYQVYEKAAKLRQSQTATLAKERLAALEAMPGINAAVSECRTLQQSHEAFQLAEAFAEADPKRASRHYQWVVEHAPKDSRLFDVAKSRLESNQR
jgi:hypothetical protein